MATQLEKVPQVYAAIAAVTLAMSKEGIGKDSRNASQGYNFRGIDQVYNALSPMLAAHRLCILPRMISRTQDERLTAKGGAIFYTTVEAEFDFVSAEDGSVHVVRTFGEAMDSADKSTNKAMSAAYKYAAMQTFCIPTEGDNDADASHHEVAPRQQQRREEPRHDPVPLITEDQRVELMALATPKGIDARAICEVGKISAISEMPAARFAGARKWVIDQPKREIGEPRSAQASDIIADDIPY